MNYLEVNDNIFEEIKHIDDDGTEYWFARELMPILEYSRWEKFNKVIENAKMSCLNNGDNVLDHFHQVEKMVDRCS